MREERLGNLTAGDELFADWKSADSEDEDDVELGLLDAGEATG